MITASTDEVFDVTVDRWVVEAIEQGTEDFGELLRILPGVYPTVALHSLRRLVNNGQLASKIIELADQYVCREADSIAPLTGLVPHPLDFEWRFAQPSVHFLASLARDRAFGETVALLGCPSLCRPLQEAAEIHKILFLDTNVPPADERLNKIDARRINLLSSFVPDEKVAMVVADPPWYLEYMQCFLWAASHLCRLGGTILLCTPPLGTRPEITEEWGSLLGYANSYGLRLANYMACALQYETPPFERNALRAMGIRYFPYDWRRGDLAIFVSEGDNKIPQPQDPVIEEWSETIVQGVRFRIRKGMHRFDHKSQAGQPRDPRLFALIPGDILPTVSRRDPRRSSADVWTSGNRIYRCHSLDLLSYVLASVAAQVPLCSFLNNIEDIELTREEMCLADDTIKQVKSIVEQEKSEYILSL